MEEEEAVAPFFERDETDTYFEKQHYFGQRVPPIETLPDPGTDYIQDLEEIAKTSFDPQMEKMALVLLQRGYWINQSVNGFEKRPGGLLDLLKQEVEKEVWQPQQQQQQQLQQDTMEF